MTGVSAAESTSTTPEATTPEATTPVAEPTTNETPTTTPATTATNTTAATAPKISAGVNIGGQLAAPVATHSIVGTPGDRYLFTESPVEYYYYHQPVV